jgi:thymidylate synthase
MHVIEARNVNDALPQAVALLRSKGRPEPSRAGDVIVCPTPVTTVYSRPTERVLFYPERDANPFAHFFEGLWMLAGRNDLTFMTRFIKNFAQYSDDGRTLHAAYGHRWRRHWRFDQIERIVALLKREPHSRRAVLTMWDPSSDLHENGSGYRDLPCNTQLVFSNYGGRLNMDVFCRSNDLVLGHSGTNVVCLSMLQEYVAARLGWEFGAGVYRQISVNLHAYLSTFDKVKEIPSTDVIGEPYINGEVEPYPLVTVSATWDRDLALFLEDPTSNGYEDPFFARVAKPLWFAHAAYQKRDDPDRFAAAREILLQCHATDWRRAAEEWVARREASFTQRAK